MSRNAKKTMELVFDTLKLHAQPNPLPYPIEWDYDRWIFGNADDFNWLTTTKIVSTINVSYNIIFSLLEFSGNLYFVTIGLNDPDTLPNGFLSIPLNPGIYTLIVAEYELPINSDITSNHIDNYILSQSNENKPYEGHDYNDFLRLFPSINAFELTDDYPGSIDNLTQMAAIFVSTNPTYVRLGYNHTTFKQIVALSYVNSDVLSYENILQALFSSNFKFAFLDLYRCIELLFQLIYIDEMHTELSISVTKTSLLRVIEDTLGWKPIERNSIKKIFGQTPKEYLIVLSTVIKQVSTKINDHSDWYYDLRCQIVHLKTKQKKIEMTPLVWNQLIEGTCQLLHFWYMYFQTF